MAGGAAAALRPPPPSIRAPREALACEAAAAPSGSGGTSPFAAATPPAAEPRPRAPQEPQQQPQPPPAQQQQPKSMVGRVLDRMADTWSHQLELDRLFHPLASAMWTGYSVRILGVLTAAQILQHVALQSCLTALTVLAWCAPAKHRRWSPPLRLCLLFLSYCIPVVTDMTVFRAQAPAPSTLPLIGPVKDAYSLWMAGRGALFGFALVGTHPPLYLALPFQIYGFWRLTAADFCAAPIFAAPAMRRRVDAAHAALSHLSALTHFAPPGLLYPETPHQRCQSLLLFVQFLVTFLAPILVLLPPAATGQRWRSPRPTGQGAAGAGPLARLQVERRLEAYFTTLLLWLQASPPHDPDDARPAGDRPSGHLEAAVACVGIQAVPPRPVRLAALIVPLWLLCCMAYT